ncbi:bifunctional proline dehydrogenase/L-glutamate gamma-semialdehyde dehydrogenase [Curtobacterium albidum]|uniref:proline dehydrogenase family protein n=1 Tax=Curtobacterium citreum TaxID=2036 RepID=UPI0020265A2D|nr:proline dehydrogenase family protein [Curtobacterium albidum]MCL9666253.1 bifunctional proline dehydrogenase/L-glutamate gamma-semialdehyde dehydrogenase [Curtobacterium albidum]
MPTPHLRDCTDDVVTLAQGWIEAARGVRPEPAAARLAELLADDRGAEFARTFVDVVVRPEDPKVVARNLERASRAVPDDLAWYLRGAVTVGGGFATMAPWAVVPSARKVLRRLAGHLVVDATPARTPAALAKVGGPDTRVDVDLLGTAVLGPAGRDRRLAAIDELLRQDVAAVTVDLDAVLPPVSPWDLDAAVADAVEHLTPLLHTAASRPTPPVITLQTGRAQDVERTVAVLLALLGRDATATLTLGVTLPAELPESLELLDRVTAAARERRAAGGAPVRVRFTKGSLLATDRVDAVLGSRPLAVTADTRTTDTAYLRLLDTAIDPERTDAVHVGVATHDPFALATAHVLAERRGVLDAVEPEVLLGTTRYAEVLRRAFGRVVLGVPLVRPDEFDAAVPYLARRLREVADPRSVVTAAGAVGPARAATTAAAAAGAPGSVDDAAVERAAAEHVDAVAALVRPAPPTRRTQDRRRPPGDPVLRSAAENTPDTDPSTPGNRAWAAELLGRVPESQRGVRTIRAARITDRGHLERLVARTAQAGVNWGRQDPEDRAELFDLIGHALETHRGALVETMIAEVGLTLSEADGEVSRAVDAATHAADRTRHLDDITGAVPVPPRLTVVVPSWNAPLLDAADGVLTALAAGSGVVLQPATAARRTGAVFADVLWDAGVPHSLLQLVDLDGSDLSRDLVAHPAVDRVVLTDTPETARSYRWWRADLPLVAETTGVVTAVVTPSADLDQAARDVVTSAFARAGQAASAVSLLVLVGSVGESPRFREQLADAVRGLRTAWPTDPTAQVGPLVAEPTGAVRTALTELRPGESWLVEPVALDDTGRLWSPGVRDGVRATADLSRSAVPAPVLDVVRVETLDEAIALQHSVDGGSVAALHTLDPDEVATWSDRTRAGVLVVDRPTTGARPGRQPVGGWRGTAVGPTVHRGGPLAVIGADRWDPTRRQPHRNIQLQGLGNRVTAVIEASRAGLSFEEFDRVRAGAESDAAARASLYGRSRDTADLVVERNVIRFRPQSVVVRQSSGVGAGELVRVLVAATAARAHVLLSTARPLPAELLPLFSRARSPLDVVDQVVEDDATFLARAAAGTLLQDGWSEGTEAELDPIDLVLAQGAEPRRNVAFGGPGSRVRLLGGDARALEEALGAGTDTTIHDDPVVESGIVEMLHFLREQTVSVTAHRHGDVSRAFSRLRL